MKRGHFTRHEVRGSINFEEVAEMVEEPAERAMNQMNEVLNRSVEEPAGDIGTY